MILPMIPAHLPTDKPTRFCTRCPGDGHHKMSCTPYKSGDVAGDQPWPIPAPHADEVTDATSTPDAAQATTEANPEEAEEADLLAEV
jgi:hypothetical protein